MSSRQKVLETLRTTVAEQVPMEFTTQFHNYILEEIRGYLDADEIAFTATFVCDNLDYPDLSLRDVLFKKDNVVLRLSYHLLENDFKRLFSETHDYKQYVTSYHNVVTQLQEMDATEEETRYVWGIDKQ